MNVYVESNFVLELALLQEQSESCESILNLCDERRVHLVIPAYSLAEPDETLARRHKQRAHLTEAFDRELRQIARTRTHSKQLSEVSSLTAMLINIADEEAKRLNQVRSRLISTAEVIPLDAPVLTASERYRQMHGLSPPDSLVYSSVISHIGRALPPQSCFLNRDRRDFDDHNIVEELGEYNCTLLPQFDNGYHFIVDALS